MKTEFIKIGEGSEFPLNGKLVLPSDTSERVPAVVFVHGSGSSNMDEKVLKLTPFKDLAEGLAERGIASVRYDKRSFVYGRKIVKKGEALTVKEETIEDAVKAADLLRKDSRIDPEKIFIVGHSMGAMLAPRIDAEGGNFRGLVLMAGTPRKIEDILFDQFDAMEETAGFLTKLALRGQIKKFRKLFENMDSVSDEEAKKINYGGGATMYYFREMGRKTSGEYLMESDKPVLILQGSADFQVDSVKDFERFKEVLKDRPNVSYKLFDGLNHCFVQTLGCSIMQVQKEYGKERHIPAEVFDTITDWIKEQ